MISFDEISMPNLTQLRIAAREIFNEALRGVDAEESVRRAVQLEGSRVSFCDVATVEIGTSRSIYSIAIGKAAPAMASALDVIIGNRIAAGVMAGSTLGYRPADGRERVDLASRWHVFQAGHPEPNDQSLAAAQACFKLLQRANQERALVIFLISGGGSAMMEWPIDESITLSDLRTAHKVLVGCGASISEINAVRRAFSAVKGGRLAARVPHCDQITLIVSDVPPGEERNVASGPTLAPPGNAPDALEVIERYNLRSHLPETILRAIEAEPSPLPADPTTLRKHFVLLDNHSALEAAAKAARQRGFVTEVATDIADQPIEGGCAQLLSRLEALRATAPTRNTVCLVSGGEFACPVQGDGLGGRNLETTLRLAHARSLISSGSEHFVALCAGTDGTDGNSPAAGAIVDETTHARARAIGLDPKDFLKRSDAYSFFVALGDAIAIGPTGTNVRDIRILLQNHSQ
jgi:glycerate 2-kinase